MRILYCIDSESLVHPTKMQEVADSAAHWGRKLRGLVDLLHVMPAMTAGFMTHGAAPRMVDVHALENEERERLRARLDQLMLMLPSELRGETKVAVGDVASVVSDQAALEPDVVLVRSARRQGIERLLFGSKSEQIARNVDVPVIVTGKGETPGQPASAG